MGIFWPYAISIDKLNERTGSIRVSSEIKKRRWKWIGHVLRIPRQHHCATALTWTPDGKRKVGRPKTTWRRTIENDIQSEAGCHGRKLEEWQKTGIDGGRVLRPYA